jgi:thiamine-phosphate pyrophosphorylase
MKYIEKFQFITHDIPHRSHIEQAQLACEAGAKWIQYRCLTKSDDELLKDINSIAEICDDWGTTLIVTDHVHLNGKADIQGFHIEDMDADFIALRNKLGRDVTLGGSSNTVKGLISLAHSGVDYAGFGPFSITETKPNNFPVLGISGYENAIQQLRKMDIQLPVLAVGGVKLQDVSVLMQTGVFGIAVSGAVNFAEDFVDAYEEFYREVNPKS